MKQRKNLKNKMIIQSSELHSLNNFIYQHGEILLGTATETEPREVFLDVNYAPKNSKILTVDENFTPAFLHVAGTMGHFLVDALGSIIELYKQNNNIKFYICIEKPKKDYFFIEKFFIDFLNFYGIKNEWFFTGEYDFIRLKNFYYKDNRYGINTHQIQKFLLEYLDPIIKNKNEKPFRKTYIARNDLMVEEKTVPLNNENKIFAKNNLRIINENLLIEYLKTKKFEIITPEEDFASFQDQINYFYSVKTIMSVTSAGLHNALFMQEKGNIIELITALYFNERTELHDHYYCLSFLKNHNFIGIPNQTCDAQDIINLIENNKHLKQIIEE